VEDKPRVTLVTMPQEFPCGEGSSCCGPLGQSEEEIGALRDALERDLGVGVDVVYANDGAQMRGRRSVAAALRTFGFFCLPILTVGDRLVAIGASQPAQAVEAAREVLQEVQA